MSTSGLPANPFKVSGNIILQDPSRSGLHIAMCRPHRLPLPLRVTAVDFVLIRPSWCCLGGTRSQSDASCAGEDCRRELRVCGAASMLMRVYTITQWYPTHSESTRTCSAGHHILKSPDYELLPRGPGLRSDQVSNHSLRKVFHFLYQKH
jgi:hypothetical protein